MSCKLALLFLVEKVNRKHTIENSHSLTIFLFLYIYIYFSLSGKILLSLGIYSKEKLGLVTMPTVDPLTGKQSNE